MSHKRAGRPRSPSFSSVFLPPPTLPRPSLTINPHFPALPPLPVLPHLPSLSPPLSPRLPVLPGVLRAALSGALAEMAVTLSVYPLDTCRTIAQTGNVAVATRGLLAGLPTGLVGSAVDAFFFSLVYDASRRLHPGPFAAGMAAAFAAVISSLAAAPFQLARDRVRLGLASHAMTAWHNAASSGGWQALFAGARPAVVRDVPLCAMEFATHAALITRAPQLIAGLMTGVVVGVFRAPLDLAVTRVVANPRRYRGVVGTLTRVVREEGAMTLLAGMRPMICKEMISSALFFAIYDALREHN